MAKGGIFDDNMYLYYAEITVPYKESIELSKKGIHYVYLVKSNNPRLLESDLGYQFENDKFLKMYFYENFPEIRKIFKEKGWETSERDITDNDDLVVGTVSQKEYDKFLEDGAREIIFLDTDYEPEWAVSWVDYDDDKGEWIGFAKNERDAKKKAELESGDINSDDIDAINLDEQNKKFEKYRSGSKYAKGGSIDAERFAKPAGWRWKNSAVEDGIVSRAALSKSPSAAMRAKYPDYVAYEDRLNKSDAHPSRKYRSLAKGGSVHHDKHLDGERTAKPQGWRWKDDAVYAGVIKKADLLKEPSEKMKDLYPELVYEEKRLSKSDKNPSAKFISLEKGGKSGKKNPEWAVSITSDDGETFDWEGFAKDEDEAVYKAEKEAGFESVESSTNMITDANGESVKYAKGGKAKSGKTKAKKPANDHTKKLKEVMAHAKATRKEGEVWKMAVKRSWQEIG